jgi:hypothetical protein
MNDQPGDVNTNEGKSADERQSKAWSKNSWMFNKKSKSKRYENEEDVMVIARNAFEKIKEKRLLSIETGEVWD